MRQSTRRVLTYGSNASLVTVMVLAVLVLVYVLADHYRSRLDLSEGASNTLQLETVEKLRLLDTDGEPVTVTAFTNQNGKEDSYFKDRAMKDLLRSVGAESKVITWRQVNFDQERLTAEDLGVTEYGHVVIQRGKDRVDLKDRDLFRRAGKAEGRRIEFLGEGALSRGFAQLMSPTRRTVYILSGHGELDPEDRGPDGISDLVAALDQERYDAEPLNLLATTREGELPRIPDDASVVFVARPRAALTPQEEDTLLAWVGRGGAVLFAIDVGTPVPVLFDRLGVRIPEGVALQPEMQVPYRDRPIPRYKSHPITADLSANKLTTILAHPAPVQVAAPPPEGLRVSPVLVSSREGWIDRGGKVVGGAAVYEPTIDGAGPVDMAVALELQPGKGLVRSSKTAARILIVGDGDAFTNAMLAEGPGNGAFAVNSVHWLTGEDRRLGVDTGGVGRAAQVRRLALTEEEMGMVRLICLGFMPIVVLLIGIGTWFTRRGR